jgi:hypothetical protein
LEDFLPTIIFQSIGESPVPGLLRVRFSGVKTSPSFISFDATMLFLTIFIFFCSDLEGVFMPFPKAFSIFQTAFTISFNDSGVSEAL